MNSHLKDITPVVVLLFHYYLLSLIPYPLSLIPYPLSLIPYPLSLISYLLSLISYLLSLITYNLYLISYILYLISYILYLISYVILISVQYLSRRPSFSTTHATERSNSAFVQVQSEEELKESGIRNQEDETSVCWGWMVFSTMNGEVKRMKIID